MSINPGYRPDQIIKDAAKHGELVVFVGAGASMLCGSPNWYGFAHAVVSQLEKKGALTFLQAEQLKGMGDSRRTLSIAMSVAREHSISIDFDSILHPETPSQVGLDLYDLLTSLRPVFVTTNYDKWLDEAGPQDATADRPLGSEANIVERPIPPAKYYLKEHLTLDRLSERGAVLHLHGSYSAPDSMVVSLRDYIEHYADERVRAFLSEMFRNHTVLFVGYGLEELEVLEHIIRSNANFASPTVEPRHFIIYAHRSTEVVQTEFTERYFRDQCGVNVIRYCIDHKGYTELLDVFKAWQSELDVRDLSTLDLQRHLDQYIPDSTANRRESALRLIERNPLLTPYFLNSLNDAVWFQDLLSRGFFEIKNSPSLKETETDSGKSFQAEGWPALRYLERVASKLSRDESESAIDIVRTISADSLRRNLNNWRTSWSLANIVSQLPIDLLTPSDFHMMLGWLRGPFDGSMVGAELGKRLLPQLLQSNLPGSEGKALMMVDVLTTPKSKETS